MPDLQLQYLMNVLLKPVLLKNWSCLRICPKNGRPQVILDPKNDFIGEILTYNCFSVHAMMRTKDLSHFEK